MFVSRKEFESLRSDYHRLEARHERMVAKLFDLRTRFGVLAAYLDSRQQPKEGAPAVKWPHAYLCKCSHITPEDKETGETPKECARCHASAIIEKSQGCDFEKRWYDMADGVGERSCICGRAVIGYPRILSG